MRSIVQIALAFAAAAGLAGVVHAGSTVAMDTVTTKDSGGTQSFGPNVAKTPSPGAPVPIPYPNMGGVNPDMEKKPVQSSKQVPLKNGSQFKQSTGDEAGTIKGVVSDNDKNITQRSATVKIEGSPVILLSPIDQYNKPPDATARQTPNTSFGSVLGRGASKASDVALGKRAVKQPGVVAPANPVDAPPHPLPVKLGPPVTIAPPPQVTPPVAAPPVKFPVVGAPPVPIPVPVAPPVSVLQPVVAQPVQPQPITLQPQPVLRR
ncbi:MAG TPA: PAAR-like domain-containing protein [Burkholderiales bacterium]|nr:PAAR-like domain-containing protein [Burkholderiales bacterium]